MRQIRLLFRCKMVLYRTGARCVPRPVRGRAEAGRDKPLAARRNGAFAMNNFTEISGLRPRDRLSVALKTRSYPLFCVFYGVGGMLLALCRIIGGQAPFGVAFLAAVPFRYTLPSLLGVCLGYLLGGGMAEGYPLIGAALVLTVARWICGEALWVKKRLWLAPTAAAAMTFAAGVLPLFYRDPLIYDVILWAAQLVMAGSAAAFLGRAFDALNKEKPFAEKADGTAIAVSAALLLIGLDAVAAGGLTLGRVAASLAVLFSACAGGEKTSCLTGVVCGLTIGLSTGEFVLYVAAYSLGGLLAGLFSAFGRAGSLAAFVSTWGLIALMVEKSVAGLYAVALAAVVFGMLPPSLLRFGVRLAAGGKADDDTVRWLIEDRLETVSAALRAVSETTEDVARRLDEISGQSMGDVTDAVAEKVCKRCPRWKDCWLEHYSATADAFGKAFAVLGGRRPPDPSDSPVLDCVKREELAKAMSEQYRLRFSHGRVRRHASRMRELVTDQFDGMALTLDSVAKEAAQIASCDRVLAARADELFRDERLEPQRTICWRGEEGRLTCSVLLPRYKMSRMGSLDMTEKLSVLAGVRFAGPILREKGRACLYTFHEMPRYSGEYGSCQLTAAGCSYCGDTLRLLTDQAGTAHVLLSDGMGSGSGAAVDSAMTAALTARLLSAGVCYEGALRLVNTALLVKSGEESLSTLDAVRVDLYSGEASFFKAGAAPTVVIREGHGIIVDSQSLPAGILSGVSFEESSLTLGEGDIVFLLSDGAVTEGCDWIVKMAEHGRAENLDDLCRRIASTARLRRSDGRDDDISVAAFRLTRCER